MYKLKQILKTWKITFCGVCVCVCVRACVRACVRVCQIPLNYDKMYLYEISY